MKKLALALVAAIGTTGCAVNTPKVAVTPAAPLPPPDPPALIFTQSVLDLPDPQPVPAAAIPKREAPAQPAVAETPPARIPQKRPPAGVKREPETAETPAPAVPQEPVKTPTRVPLVPVDPDLPRSDMIQRRLDALKAMKSRLDSKQGGNAEMIRSRVQYFVEQAGKALARQDLRQADSLITRAEVLAQDLLRVR